MSIFGLGLQSWEHIMLLSLGFTGLAAIAVFISTMSVVTLQRRENANTQHEYKEFKLTVDAKVADAKQEGIVAGKQAGDALLKAAKLEKEAQKLKAENLSLQLKIQPRRLSGENIAKLKNSLIGLHPSAIAVISRIFDSEGGDFADDLSNAFQSAGWSTVRENNWTMPNKGVSIATLEGTPIPSELKDKLLAALHSANVKASTITIKNDKRNTISPYFQPNVLYLLIGEKP